jgi:Cu-processing system permease protein
VRLSGASPIAVSTIARLEFSTATRQRWIRIFAVAFALLSVALAYSVGAAQEAGGPEGFARTTVALVPLVLVLVPLAALLFGVSGHAGEPGSEAFLFTQPVTRSEVLVGRWAGQFAALAVAVTAGFGAGGALLVFVGGTAGVPRYLFFLAASLMLAGVFLSLGAAIAAGVGSRASSLGVAAFAWFFFVLLYDAVALAIAGWAPGRTGARILFFSVFGNPTDLIRVLVLSVSGTPHVLGAAGDSWIRLLGGRMTAGVLSAIAVALWIAAPLEAARRLLAARDL